MSERWAPIRGYEGRYEVSDGGRVRSCRGVIGSTRGTQPYRRVELYADDGARTTMHVHTLVLEAFGGPRPEGMVARHLNGDPDDCSLDNLAWGTFLENEADKREHGRIARGARNGQTTLTEADVRAIRASSESQRAIARRFGITQSAVSLIVNRKSWAWL